MIAAFLCGLMYGALIYRAWWIKPRELKANPLYSLYGEDLSLVLPVAKDWKPV